jgi:glutathione S-transferase
LAHGREQGIRRLDAASTEMDRMRLYVLPGACSLASHIALEVAAERAPAVMPPWDVVVLERGRNHDAAYTAVNPLGTVPALVTASGQLIVESLAVLLHIADAVPQAELAPPAGDAARDRIHTLLSVMVTAGHTAFQMLWRSERFADNDDGRASAQRMCALRIGTLFQRLDQELRETGYLIGTRATVADMYLYVLGRWGLRLERPTSLYPALWRFTQRMSDCEPVRRAMAREGIALQGPKAGLG